ncbi:MAG TPA: permease-like cell division protein FtsX [Acidimicrobiales bacterium]|jgi:cell division transport system permease protein|nr:permease-like cell division protein FtsX [Acidimicrobiales bacterium]
MAISGSYVVRETGVNLRRNMLMTIAAVITMAVSLTLVASALLMKQAIAKASVQWRGGVELSIFLQPTVTPNQQQALGKELDSNPEVKKVRFVDKPAAYTEFKQMFANTPDLVNSLTVNDMPPSYRVVPSNAADVNAIGQQFQSQPGVDKVVYAKEVISNILQQFNTRRKVAIVLAIGAFAGAFALIVNTIQLAIFARRREIAVMKLVGATNWFIQIPFMLEGVVQGILGALLAFGISFLFRSTIASLASSGTLVGGPPLYVTTHEAILTGVAIMVVGGMIGVVGSAFSVRRFLSV